MIRHLFELDRHLSFLYQTVTMEHVEIREEELISLKNITLRVRDTFILPNTSWKIKTDQNWAVIGPNGSGKSSLVGAVVGNVPVVSGDVVRHTPRSYPEAMSYVSFELEQRLIAREESLDEARFFSGKLDTFVKSRDIIGTENQDANFEKIVDQLEIRSLLGRGIRFLSTGEMRKILIARALMRSPSLLILDEPFEGLDAQSKGQLAELINNMINGDSQLLLVTNRIEEITSNISHILCLKDNAVFLQGPREKVLASEKMPYLFEKKGPVALSLLLKKKKNTVSEKIPSPVLVEIKNTTVKYGKLLVIDNLNWSLKKGENWAVLGPNGSGKSTLVNLILGDNLQAYANDIYLFGKRKGSGETVWDIKKKIGFVSSGLQIHYRKQILASDVILSGFFDSIGLYRHATPEQQLIAQGWIETLGISEKSKKRFNQLSYGEKRLILIARAMVKSPPLLIMDEPCQGLDKENRKMILDLIEYIGEQTDTTLLYITHHQGEIPPCFTHILRLHKPNAGET